MGPDQGWYFEEGIAPSYTFLPKSDYPITLTAPVTSGQGTKQVTTTVSTFGYVSAGVTLSVPLAFMPKQLGSWTASASYLLYYLANGVATNSPVAFLPSPEGNHKQIENVFSGTIGLTF